LSSGQPIEPIIDGGNEDEGALCSRKFQLEANFTQIEHWSISSDNDHGEKTTVNSDAEEKTFVQSAAELEERFGIEHRLRFDEAPGGIVRAIVSTPAADAEVYLQGAHVAKWTPRNHPPVLFLSERSDFAPGKAIRGGVPIIFPWFGPRGGGLPGPSHGFARTSEWTLEEAAAAESGALRLLFTLKPNAVSRRFGYDRFHLRYRVSVGTQLELELEVTHDGEGPLQFEEALHSYFAVGAVEQVAISGLGGTEYYDKVDGGRRKRQQGEPLRFAKETDQVHVNTEAVCVIDNPLWHRRIVVEKSGSRSTIVWNPWEEKTRGLKDMQPDGWRGMVCVESGNAADDTITLASGGGHTMRTVIRLE
jgi:glucose-6-phosphate 1-epimerase